MTLEQMILLPQIKFEHFALEWNYTNTYHKNAGFSSLHYGVASKLERLERTWEWETKPWFKKEIF